MSLSAVRCIDSMKPGEQRYTLYMAFANDLQIQVYRIFLETPYKVSSKEATCIVNIDKAHTYGEIERLEFYYNLEEDELYIISGSQLDKRYNLFLVK